jgi:hypothetical protein
MFRLQKITTSLCQKTEKNYISRSPVRLISWSTKPKTNYDEPNPCTTLLGFEMTVNARQKAVIQVLLIPGSVKNEKTSFNKSLEAW